MFWRRKRDQEPDEDGTLLLSGAWTADIWDRKPIRVPAVVDVDSFLDQSPMPSLWPDDAEFNDYAGGDDESLRRMWVMALLHHPDRDAVVRTLRSPHLEDVTPHAVTVADLVIDSPVAEEAAEAVWRMTDDGVTVVLNVVLNRGIVSSGHSPPRRTARSSCCARPAPRTGSPSSKRRPSARMSARPAVSWTSWRPPSARTGGSARRTGNAGTISATSTACWTAARRRKGSPNASRSAPSGTASTTRAGSR